LMRVTNNMLVNTLLRNVNSNLSTMQKQQDQLSTGKRVAKPSDDPVAVSKIIKYKTDINELKQYDTNTKDALSWTQTSELAISDISSALARTRELAVQAASETNTIEEREKIAMEVEQLKEHIIGSGNKTFAGKYIFSSFQTDKKLLNADGTFNINITQNELDNKPTTTYEVGVGETMKVSTNGLDLFGAVIDTSYFPANMPTGENEGARGTKASFVGEDFDRTLDHSGDTLQFAIDGTTYTVDMTNLVGTTKAPIANSDFKNAILNADDGGVNLLKAVATVTFDSNNNLVIESNAYGAASQVEYTAASTDIFSTQTPGDIVNGTNLTEASVAGSVALTDGDINSDISTRKIVVEYFGETQEIEIDMSLYTTVGGYTTALETELDNKFADKISELQTKFGGAYDISASGNPITFETTGSAIDGPIPELNVRTIKSQTPQMIKDLDDFINALKTDDTAGISAFIGNVDNHLETINSSRSEIGAKTNRLEMILKRIEDDNINVTQLLSNNQDVDMAETIMLLKNAENVYKASLSAGARVIQPSLLDFLR
ncbi:flagellar hook-associated protein FlgL, partial [Clostridiaceae bacterium HSG29]|nr:flagellar hook-associated protein FlgL [Clostridiaceae bacterium HSG29]